MISSFIKLQLLGDFGGQSITDGTTALLVGNDHLLPWGSSSRLYCWLQIRSRGIKAKLMVTTSKHVLVNIADFGDLEIEGDVFAAKRSHDDDTLGGESDGVCGTSALTESDADVVPQAQTLRSLPQTKISEKEESTCGHSAESGVAGQS